MELTPDNVISELQRIQKELNKAPNALYEAELALAEAEHEYDKVVSLALLNAESKTVGEREAIAAIEAGQAKLARDLAKAAVNRVRTKIKVLESAAVATSVIGKQVELMWKVGA
jgi:hypothetical protein